MKKNFNDALRNGLAGGLLSCAAAGILNYYILPFPKDILGNAINHGVGGFFSGFFSGLVGILIFIRHANHREN